MGLKKRPSNPFILKNNDIITVYAPIRAKFQPTISVKGEVKFPKKYYFREAIKYLLEKIIALAGGLTNNSNLESSFIVRDSLRSDF